jgi:hypothetical protein
MHGLEERGTLRGLVGSGTVRGVGGSEWLEDSGVQGASPFRHHRIYPHIYKGAPGGIGAADPQSPAKCARQQMGASASAALKTPYDAARGLRSLFHLTLHHIVAVVTVKVKNLHLNLPQS